MDLTPASGFKRRPAASSSSPAGAREITRSPPSCSPSLSPSSPSSDPSSPLSTSSSVCANSSLYQNHVKGQTRGTEVARVSSTSASLPTSSLNSAPDSLPRTSAHPDADCEEEGRKKEMYDPFHPTEGDKEVRVEVEADAEEGDGEKYDPFDPTGSPASDTDDGASSKIRGGAKNSEMGNDEAKDEEPPDSTDAFADPLSPSLPPQLPLRRRVDCSVTKSRGEHGESGDSEIEEGEIVGAADRDGNIKRAAAANLPLNSPNVSFFGSKPERILRVLDGDGFVSVCAEGSWEVDREPVDEPVIGVEDLRTKLVSRRKERYLSFPASSALSPQPPPPPSHPTASPPPSPLAPPVEQTGKNRKSSKSSKEQDRQKSKDRKAGEKEERRKKRRKDKEGARERSKERADKSGKETKSSRRSSRSSSRKRKKRRHSSPEVSGRGGHARRSFSSLSDERHRERDREKDRARDRTGERDRERERDRDRDRGRERERDRDRDRENRTSSHRRDERDRESSSRKEDRDRKRRHSSSRERDMSKGSNRSREKRDGDRERQRDRERRRDGRPVVPPSIQDLNGSDLFAIKRTITVTTTTTTTTVPGSPRLAPSSPCRPAQDSDKPHKRKKKRKWRSAGEEDEEEEEEDRGSCQSRSQSPSPPRYHSYESDRYSDKLEIDVLSLDGEALDSDYPSLEDTPPAALPPEPPAPSPKTKPAPKAGRHHTKKKSRTLKKIGQSESSSSSSNRTKSKCLSSLSVTAGAAPVLSGLPSVKRTRKLGKDKERQSSRKDLGRSGKSKKESGSRKGKLQSKVSVLVREGVSSTTGSNVGSGKLGMDLLGSGGTGGGGGGSVVGGSIAVVFCRDNESRSPFLKPCSEPLSLSGRGKDLSNIGKRSSLAAPPSSLTAPTGLKSKKTKPSSITSTSSSASSPSSSLATKRRRRLAKKSREKGGASGLTAGDSSQNKATSDSWSGASLDVQSAGGEGTKSISPHAVQTGPAPCSSSSSSTSSSSFTSVLPPSSSPPHTPPPSMAPLRDTRESSPDSQTVDSSCKTPEPSFLAEDCPTQTSPTLPPSSPSSLSTSQGAGLSNALSASAAKPPPPDDAPKSLASPPCSSSSVAGCGLASLSLPLSSSDPSSSSVSSSSASKPPPPPPPPAAPALPWSLPTGVDCTTGGVLALTALLFKMEEANIASRAKAQEFIQATSQILSQANQSQSQQHAPPSSASSSSSSQIPPPPSLPPPPPGLSPAQFILHGSLPLVGCTKTPPSHLHPSIGGGCAQTPPPILPGVTGNSGDAGWENESKDPDKYLKKLHTQERAVEEVKLAIKPYYQRKDINKDEYKDILRKAVHKICHSRTGEINPVKVSNLVKLYVQRYKYFRKHGRKMDEEERDDREPGALHSSA